MGRLKQEAVKVVKESGKRIAGALLEEGVNQARALTTASFNEYTGASQVPYRGVGTLRPQSFVKKSVRVDRGCSTCLY